MKRLLGLIVAIAFAAGNVGVTAPQTDTRAITAQAGPGDDWCC